MSFVLDWVFDNRWAITPTALEAILSVVDREDLLTLADRPPEDLQVAFHVSPTDEDKAAIEALDGEHLEGTRRVSLRENVAVLPVIGPIVPRASFFARMSGMADVQGMAKDLRVALDSPDVDAILLNIDSPGGVVTGIAEFADMLFAAQAVKPIVAYVYGLGASAAYWIASATSEIVTAPTAETGSIGIVAAYTDYRKADEKRGIRSLEIVSSVSPKKRPDVFTDEGKAQVQRAVDDLADIFVATVARNRGTTEEDVRDNFGKGDVLVGQRAVDSGLTDRIGSLESIISELQTQSQSTFSTGGIEMPMTLEELRAQEPEAYRAAVNEGRQAATTDNTQAVADAREAGATAERERIQGIEALDAPGYESVIADNKFNAEATAESVSKLILDAQKEKREATAKNQKEDGEDLAGKLSGVETSQGSALDSKDEEEAVVAQMAAGGNKTND